MTPGSIPRKDCASWSAEMRPPVLVIGLGNPLMGDEGIGWHIAQRLSAHPNLPTHVEAICGGTDLLRCADQIMGRRHVILVDALLGDGQPGEVVIASDCLGDFESHQGHAHCLSAVEAIRLLRAVTPGLDAVRFTLIGIGIGSAALRSELAPSLTAKISSIVDWLCEELAAETGWESQVSSGPASA